MPSCLRLIVAFTGILLFDVGALLAQSGSDPPLAGNGLDYSGAVQPLDAPIRLRYRGGVSLRRQIQVQSLVRVSDREERQDYQSEFEAIVTARDNTLVWELRLWKLREGAKQFAFDQPLVLAIRSTDARGEVKTVRLSFPAFVASQGQPPAPGSPLYETLMRQIKSNTSAFPVLPDAAVGMGDVVYRLDAAPVLSNPSAGLAARGELVARAAGLVVIDQKKHLLLELKGELTLTFRGAPLSGPVTGFSALDVVTGLVTVSTTEARLAGKMEGIDTTIVLRRHLEPSR